MNKRHCYSMSVFMGITANFSGATALADINGGSIDSGDKVIAEINQTFSIKTHFALSSTTTITSLPMNENNSWTRSGGQNPNHNGNKVLNFNLEWADTLEINLTSSSADTFLYLLDSHGNVIQQNDDGGVGYNSYLKVDLSQGKYSLVAATYHVGVNSSFNLRVEPLPLTVMPQEQFQINMQNGYAPFGITSYRNGSQHYVAYIDSSGNGIQNDVVIYDVAEKSKVSAHTVSHWYNSIHFLKDQPVLIFSDGDNLYRQTIGNFAQLVHQDIGKFELSDDNTQLVSYNDSNVRIFSYPDMTLEQTLPVTISRQVGRSTARQCGLSKNNQYVALDSGYEKQEVEVFDLITGTSKVYNATGATATYSPSFSDDNEQLYVGGGYSDGHIYTFDLESKKLVNTFKPFSEYVYNVQQFLDNRYLLTAGYNGAVKIINRVSGAEYWSSENYPGSISHLAINGKYIYSTHGSSGTLNSKVTIFEIK